MIDWLFESAWRFVAAFVLATGLLAGLIVLVLWLTGALHKPMCPAGKSLILLPVGKVLVPECIG